MNESVEFNLRGDDADAVMLAVNQGIDARLEACYVPDRGDKFTFNGGGFLNCQISRESMPTLIRRLKEAKHDHLVNHLNVMASLDEFTTQYLITALWSSIDDDGEPLDNKYGLADIAPETLAKMSADCQKFLAKYKDMVAEDLGRAGHDFWLTRNHHGAGFWSSDWRDDIGKTLTAASHRFGEFNLFVGDDNLIY